MQCILQANGDARLPLLKEDGLHDSWGDMSATATLRKYGGNHRVKILVDAAFDLSRYAEHYYIALAGATMRRCRERR
jgi:hypothetical protein